MRWAIKDCFIGDECWCGIIVNPEGIECNHYGEIQREACQLIVDALNNNIGAKNNNSKIHPLPWVVEQWGDGSMSVSCLGYTPGDEFDLEHCVIAAGGTSQENMELFVKAVNEFYNEANIS